MSRPSDFVTETRQADQALIDVMDQFNALRREWDALNYLETLDDEGSDAFDGSNADTNVAEVAAVIGTTVDALNDLLKTGHATNLYTLL